MNNTIQTGTVIDCEEHEQLRDRLARAIQSLVKAQASHTTALRVRDSRVTGFEEDLYTAADEWKMARKSYARHVLEHGC